MMRIGVLVVLFCCCLFAVGCGSGKPQTLQVSGSVKTKDGKPCDNALVVFHPQEAERVNAPKPFAKTDAQGHFILTTEAEGDGAPAGKYGVTVVWHGDGKEAKFSLSGEGKGGGADKLNGRYANPRSPVLLVEVVRDSANRFDLAVE